MKTGAFTLLGAVIDIVGGDTGDVARLPGGLLYGMNGSADLVLIDPVALTTSLVGDSGNRILALAFRPDGTLFGVSLNSDLYTINPDTGAATSVAALTGTGFPGIGGYFDLIVIKDWQSRQEIGVNIRDGSLCRIGFVPFLMLFHNGWRQQPLHSFVKARKPINAAGRFFTDRGLLCNLWRCASDSLRVSFSLP